MTMSSSTNETRNSLQICNECGDQMELLTSRTTKNSNHKFWKCKGCKNFQWAEDCKSSEEKIDLLVKEVRKLTLGIECLSIKFKLSHKELENMQQYGWQFNPDPDKPGWSELSSTRTRCIYYPVFGIDFLNQDLSEFGSGFTWTQIFGTRTRIIYFLILFN